MPQLSLYIDNDTLYKIETAAQINKVSVSKFVSVVLRDHFFKSWPSGYQNIFGAIKDDSFKKLDYNVQPLNIKEASE